MQKTKSKQPFRFQKPAIFTESQAIFFLTQTLGIAASVTYFAGGVSFASTTPYSTLSMTG